MPAFIQVNELIYMGLCESLKKQKMSPFDNRVQTYALVLGGLRSRGINQRFELHGIRELGEGTVRKTYGSRGGIGHLC
jgi:hypothetical protein